MSNLMDMAIRSVDGPKRQIVGVVAPYDETTKLTNIGAERMRFGCFAKSIEQRGAKIPLLVNHTQYPAMGMAREWADEMTGLVGLFQMRTGEEADKVLADVQDGWLPALSVGFEPLQFRRAADGVVEHLEARLVEVSLVTTGAYPSALVTATRSAVPAREQLLAPFANPPQINLAPIPRRW